MGAHELLLIVSRDDLKTYIYLRDALASQGVEVVLDCRNGDRRRMHQPPTPDRRHGDRRQCDLTTDLQMSGWALVHR